MCEHCPPAEYDICNVRHKCCAYEAREEMFQEAYASPTGPSPGICPNKRGVRLLVKQSRAAWTGTERILERVMNSTIGQASPGYGSKLPG